MKNLPLLLILAVLHGHAVCRMERRRDVLCRKSGADHRNGS